MNGEQSQTIHRTQDSSQSLAVVNGEQSRKAKIFHRAFTNYDLLLHALDASSIYLREFRRVAPPKSGEAAHVTCGKCDFGGATLNNLSLGCSYVLPRLWDPGGVSSSANTPMIQFPPEMDENWVRYGLAKLGQISRLPNWQRMLFCAYTTQLLHSTGEVCWNNKDSYFIWFEFVCRNSGQIASRRSWKRSCLGLEYTSKCSRLALLWEPN